MGCFFPGKMSSIFSHNVRDKRAKVDLPLDHGKYFLTLDYLNK